MFLRYLCNMTKNTISNVNQATNEINFWNMQIRTVIKLFKIDFIKNISFTNYFI